MPDFDLAVVGSGFAGSLLAMIARQLGKSVILLEKHSHPRMVIGESSTPLANLMLEQLTTRYGLPTLTPFTKWGSWQRQYPSIACGLKRGFSFFHHQLGHPCTQQFLVEASPHDEIADTHWYRPDFDAFFVRESQRLGVEYLDHALLDQVELSKDNVRLLGSRHGQRLKVSAKFVVDATGPRGFLHRALGLAESQLPGFPQTQAIYNHFSDVGVLDPDSQHNFPVNDAAVHHVFDGGWIWVLRFNNGLTSAGVAGRRDIVNSPADWGRLLAAIPELQDQFSQARALYDFRHLSQVSFRSSQISGHRWALLPSAAGFVDPLLSTGFPLTLLGIQRLAHAMETGALETGAVMTDAMEAYSKNTDQDLLTAASLIGALYANMHSFDLFSRISLLYFAAVSYAETAQRLGKGNLAPSYLLREHPVFGPEMRDLLQRASARDQTISTEILDAIEPFDVAGLRKNADKNWFPVDATDLLHAAAKLQSSSDEIEAMLTRSGFYATASCQYQLP